MPVKNNSFCTLTGCSSRQVRLSEGCSVNLSRTGRLKASRGCDPLAKGHPQGLGCHLNGNFLSWLLCPGGVSSVPSLVPTLSSECPNVCRQFVSTELYETCSGYRQRSRAGGRQKPHEPMGRSATKQEEGPAQPLRPCPTACALSSGPSLRLRVLICKTRL